MPAVVIKGTPPPLFETSSVEIARPGDLSFLHDLQKLWANNLGYLHKTAISTLIDAKCAWKINENSLEAGYLLIYPQKQGILKVVQIAIEPILLRTTLGSELMETLIAAALNHSCTTIRLNSRQDLAANAFWPTLGFSHSATTRSKNKDYPFIFEWTKNLITKNPSYYFDEQLKIQRNPR